MERKNIFGAVLTRLRKERGYSGAHQFYKSVGGSKTLGLSFMSYWDLERGKKLPKSWRLLDLMAALGIERNTPPARELVKAYFRELSGSDELVNILGASEAPAADPAADPINRDPLGAVAGQAQARRSVNLTIEQWKVLADDLVADISHDLLLDTSGWVNVSELSADTGFKPQEIKKAFKALAACGLIELSGDKARSRHFGKVVNPLPMLPETAKLKTALREHMNAWLSGATLLERRSMSLRMTNAGMEMYRRQLETAVNLASAYGDPEADRSDSEIYSINTQIYHLSRREKPARQGQRGKT